MKKRYISLLLSFVLVLSMLPPVTYAADDVASIDVTETTAATEPSDTTEAVETTQAAETTQTTEATEATEATETTEATEATETTESTESTEPAESLVPDCSCDNAGIPAENHQDFCALKMFYKNLCALSAQEIRRDWDKYPADGQDYILKYLSWNDQAKQKELEKLIALEPDEAIGETPDGAEVFVSGVPEGSAIQVTEASAETKAIVETFIRDQGFRGAVELFAWDISLCDADNTEIQPDGRVRVELEIPGKHLHKYATVYVIHVGDNGVAEKLAAQVTEDGKISFVTESFSTFAGFTVDFEFQGAQFSIPGATSIMLSELFDQLKMPLYVTDVADVTFTNTDLVTVTGPVNGDWELTSLVAFASTETLTVTMKDGTVYEITVTDAASPTISYNGSGNLDGGVIGVVEWTLNDYTWNSSNGAAHTEDYDIYINGANATDKSFEIVLQRSSSATGRTLYLDLNTIVIKGGANVTFRFGASITNENTDKVVIRHVRGYWEGYRDEYTYPSGSGWYWSDLFSVENGSLNLKVPYANQSDVRMEFNADTAYLPAAGSEASKNCCRFVYLGSGATSFTANQCDFLNARNSAFYCVPSNLTSFTMTDCSFGKINSSGTVSSPVCSQYRGGAIRVDADAKFGSMTLTNVRFNGNYSGTTFGGAIAFCGTATGKLKFDGCTFTNCTAASHGGAINISNGDSAVSVGSLEFKNCTFTNGQANNRGGGVRTWFSDSTPVTIDGCTFTGCTAGSYGGAFSQQGVMGNFTVKNGTSFEGCTGGELGAISLHGTKVGNIAVSGSTFTGNSAGSRGGAIGVSCPQFGTVTLSDSTFSGNAAGTLGGAVHLGNKDSGTVSAGAITVTNCTFTDNTSQSLGGALCVTDGTYPSVTVTDSTFSDCDAAGYGGAIGMRTNATAKPFSVTGAVLVENCDFDGCDGGSLSLEAWDHDGDSSTPAVTTWDHDGDPSTEEIPHLNGVSGAGAIAIGGTVGASITIQGSDGDLSTFTNCTTWNNGGAIAFLSDLETPKITLDYLNIDGCRARDAGNAIHLSSITADSFELKNSTIQNCTYFTPGFSVDEDVAIPADYADLGEQAYVAYDASGTFRSIGNTSTVALIENCTFRNNTSYYNGGAAYWNANRIAARTGGSTIYPALTLKHSVFDGNTALRDGGGLYVEATVNVVGCEVMNNTAQNRGGAIAQQVYDNTSRVLGEGEATDLQLDANTSIHDNSAVHGGGISVTVEKTKSIPQGTTLLYPVRFSLGGASVFNNKATGNGGGIYYAAKQYPDDANAQSQVDNYQKEILIDNGMIYGNIAGYGADTDGRTLGGNGGGIYMESSQTKTGTDTGYSKLTISGGHIYSNTACNGNGGGIYMTGNNAECSITGGVIGGSEAEKNIATRVNGANGNGGGIAISGGALIEMKLASGATTGGEISYNEAGGDGGGVWLDAKNNTAGTGANRIIIDEGSIIYNTAGACGGGISMKYRSEATLNGGSVSFNTAVNNGGGLEIWYYADMTMSGGTIEGNVAETGTGGGISAHWYGTALIKGDSTIKLNKADNSYGGGIYAHYYNVNVQGGEITENTAKYGGGVGAYNKSQITITGGDIYKNSAGSTTINGNGGGIFANESTVTVSGGNIYQNDASYGGGIAAEYGADCTVNGGSIYENIAINGGGIWAYQDTTTVSVTGGDIRDNECTGTGGGIHVDGATVTVSKADGSTGGRVTGNTASRGGGVYVSGGGDLTVNDGFVVDNFAVGRPTRLTTAYQQNHQLAGTGGGIYVADGSADDPSTFTLTGSSIAIYGNLADFAADDVFANGVYTQLTIPDVSGMNLVGYSNLTPDGWFEDYPTDDTAYTLGLNLGTSTGITDGNVWRYRNAELGSQKAIVAGDGLTKAQTLSTYVCMTLGIGSGTLTINKAASGPFMVPNQTFVFHVTGTPYDTHETAVDMYVVVTVDENGSGQTVVSNLPYGVYTVTECTDWSWRYTSTVSTKTPSSNVVVDKDNKDWVVSFTNTMTKEKWLSGAAYADNKFGIPDGE